MGKNETIFDPKSSTVLKQWLDGNRIYHKKTCKNFRFGPNTVEGQKHFSLELNKISEWFTNPSNALQSWDSFKDTYYDDEYRMNTVTRLIIVAFILLVIVGVRKWWIVLIVGLFLILILWCTLIPSVQGSTQSKMVPKVQYLRCQPPVNNSHRHRRDKEENVTNDFSLYQYIPKTYIEKGSAYRLLPKNGKCL